MENEKTAWIVLRAIGIYIAFEALVHTINLAGYLSSLYSLYQYQDSSQWAESEIIQKWVSFGVISAKVVLYLVLSYYFLRKGAFLHKLLMHSSETTKT
ncbi:MAG: hypothetical protein OQL06_10445 [Gammaproteobacteria bacterium]|nr:hypothetical protein [Gammaproteobacteria bacterium]